MQLAAVNTGDAVSTDDSGECMLQTRRKPDAGFDGFEPFLLSI